MLMQRSSVDDVRIYIDWLSNGRRDAQGHATELLSLSGADREARFAAIPAPVVLHTLDALLRHAATDLLSAPDRAADLTEFVTLHLSDATAPEGCDLALKLLQGTAWKERANALRETGDLPSALAAATRAMGI